MHILKHKEPNKCPMPQTRKYITGELIEVVKLTWNNNLIEEYVCTIKCKKHIGCSCGINVYFNMINNVNEILFPRVQHIKGLFLRYGIPVITPMLTREDEKGNTENEVSDIYFLYGPLDVQNELMFYNELKITKKNKTYNRKELYKKYGHLINACPVSPL